MCFFFLRFKVQSQGSLEKLKPLPCSRNKTLKSRPNFSTPPCYIIMKQLRLLIWAHWCDHKTSTQKCIDLHESVVSLEACPSRVMQHAAWPSDAGSRCLWFCCWGPVEHRSPAAEGCSTSAGPGTGSGSRADTAGIPAETPCSHSCPGRVRRTARARRRQDSAWGCWWWPCVGETVPADGTDWEETKRRNWFEPLRCRRHWRREEMENPAAHLRRQCNTVNPKEPFSEQLIKEPFVCVWRKL